LILIVIKIYIAAAATQKKKIENKFIWN
jgi:hypothetical protein